MPTLRDDLSLAELLDRLYELRPCLQGVRMSPDPAGPRFAIYKRGTNERAVKMERFIGEMFANSKREG